MKNSTIWIVFSAWVSIVVLVSLSLGFYVGVFYCTLYHSNVKEEIPIPQIEKPKTEIVIPPPDPKALEYRNFWPGPYKGTAVL